jgi:hypothetical protein
LVGDERNSNMFIRGKAGFSTSGTWSKNIRWKLQGAYTRSNKGSAYANLGHTVTARIAGLHTINQLGFRRSMGGSERLTGRLSASRKIAGVSVKGWMNYQYAEGIDLKGSSLRAAYRIKGADLSVQLTRNASGTTTVNAGMNMNTKINGAPAKFSINLDQRGNANLRLKVKV